MAAQRRRLTILGLDGLSLPLARRLAELHRLPAVASLATAPSARTVPSELPELSPVNWTALATASGPETHGVYGFTRLDPTDFSLSLTDFSHVQAPTVFDRLGEAGLTSRVVNLPNTYPARPIPGMLVSGFVAPNLHRACHPPMLAAMLEQRGYLLEADTTRGAAEPDHLLAQLRQTIASRRSALDLLWDDLDWDCFCLVLTETDRLFHFLLPAALDPDNHLFAPITAVLRQWDELVGEVLERHHDLPEPKRFITVADHGFTETITEVDLNAVLRDMGLLRLRHEPRDEWDTTAIDPASRAFALDPSRVYIHTSDRFPHGPVPRPRPPPSPGPSATAWPPSSTTASPSSSRSTPATTSTTTPPAHRTWWPRPTPVTSSRPSSTA
ncbi:alkaline phosphatase family protein [Desulfohalovibrio reitneri]|uniref:alkaline phosphatase family protein n=1 Tax=Desulfohalovibrio reitneri TaxID=1307759 RepID=UPI000A59E0D2|nr:alkaline phosphatase family protein [Desulfohalovibrio reitneri]